MLHRVTALLFTLHQGERLRVKCTEAAAPYRPDCLSGRRVDKSAAVDSKSHVNLALMFRQQMEINTPVLHLRLFSRSGRRLTKPVDFAHNHRKLVLLL